MESGNLDVRIEFMITTTVQIEGIVKLVDEIRKEYNCNCTLILKDR